MRTKPCLHCLTRGNTNTGPVKTGKNHFREILCGISITPQSDGEAKTSAVRPRKQPYNPRSGSSKADRQAPVAFSFRGLDIRHRLPDAKRSRELLRAPGGALCLSGFRHPRTVRTRPTSIIGHTQCLWQFATTGGVSSRAATAAHSPLPTAAACSCRNATLKIRCAHAHQ